jgi:hypothetical protein
MENTTRHSRRTRLKRIIAAVCAAAGFAVIVIESFTVHARGIALYVAPFLAFACGLDYLWSTRGRS